MNESAGQILVIVPTFNEKQNIASLVGEIRRLPGDVHVLVVDDNSPDGTGAIVDALAHEDLGVYAIHRTHKQGLGTAYKTGFAFGVSCDYQYLCTMDADFSHMPSALPRMISAARTYDVVIGSRYVAGGEVQGSTAFRRSISYTANAIAHLILGIKARDCTAGFRCYRRQVLEAINPDTIFSNGYSFLIEMAFRCQQEGFSIGEVPITFVNRRHGTSKISRREVYKALYTVIRLRTQFLPWPRFMHLWSGRQSNATIELPN